MLHLFRVFPCFTILGCFHVSPSSGVFIFQLSRVFSFSPFWDVSMFHFSRMISFFDFLRCFIFHPFRVFLCCCTSTATDLGEHFLLSGTFLPYTPSSHLAQPAFIKASLGAAVVPWRLQGLPLSFETQTEPICLFESRSVRPKVLVVGSDYVFRPYRTLHQPLPGFEPAV